MQRLNGLSSPLHQLPQSSGEDDGDWKKEEVSRLEPACQKEKEEEEEEEEY